MDHQEQVIEETPDATPAALTLLGAFEARDEWSAAGWCRVERALDVIGTRSAMVLVRELLYDGHRFEELTRRTGLSEAVAAGRLKQLHADGIVERRPYREPGKRTRDEYVLTERGRGLYPVIVALMQWGEGLADDHRSGVELVHRDCGAVLEAQVRCVEGHDVPLEEGGVRLKDEALALRAKRAGRV